MIQIVPFNPTWSGEFDELSNQIGTAIGARLSSGALVRIDHIGSTSIPGMSSKDIIDIQVSVAGRSDLDAVIGGLEKNGFKPFPQTTRDHVPPFGPLEEEQWEKRFCHPPEGSRRANIHIRSAAMANQRYALLFRDYLRTHQHSAAAYCELKKRLAKQCEDTGIYADIKDPVCDLVMLQALTWAETTSWSP